MLGTETWRRTPFSWAKSHLLPRSIAVVWESKWYIHVQYTQTELIRLRHFTTRLDSHRVVSGANRLPAWRTNNRGNGLCRFDQIESNQQHFQPTLHSLPEVKIGEIKTHEPSSFLKRGHNFSRVVSNRVESTTFLTHPTLFAQVDFRHVESTAVKTTRVDSIDSNWKHFQRTLKAQISYIF